MKDDSSNKKIDDDLLFTGISSYMKPTSGMPSWVGTLLGIMEILLGFFLIMFPFWGGLVSIWIAGIFFFLLGIFKLAQLFRGPVRSLFWSILYVVVYVFLGLYMIFQTPEALGNWTLVLGIIFTVVGISKFFVTLGLKGIPGWGWMLFNSLVTTILGCIILFGWPETSLWLVGTLVGIELLMSGWLSLMIGSSSNEKN